jgi:hypothetical protein
MTAMDRTKLRTAVIPIETYRSIKITAAQMDKSMIEILAEAWATYVQSINNTLQQRKMEALQIAAVTAATSNQ